MSDPVNPSAAGPQQAHRIDWTISRGSYGDGEVEGTVTCSAPEGAFCRLVCPDGCEEWSPEHGDDVDGHSLTDSGQCNVVVTIENAESVQMCYVGPNSAPLCSGPIVASWQGDYYGWEYPAATGRQQS